MRGDDQFTVLFIAGDTAKPAIVVPTAKALPECCVILPLFGNSDYVANSDEFKQDETSFKRAYDPNAIDSVEFVIQKCGVNGFEDKHTITNNDYGIYVPLGAEVVNGFSLVSIKLINWSKVLVDFGAGIYRIKTNENSIFATEPVQNDFSFEYDLKEFTVDRADKTVFFKVSNDGSMGSLDPRQRMAFPANWVDGIRLPGSFGKDNRDYTKTYHQLESGKRNFTEEIARDKFIYSSRLITEGPRNFFKNELMMANLVEITDYNKNAANTHINTPVHGDGAFSPTYPRNNSKAFFEVQFTDAFDNQNKKHCVT